MPETLRKTVLLTYFRLVLAARGAEKLQKSLEKIKNLGLNTEAIFVPTDVSKEDDCKYANSLIFINPEFHSEISLMQQSRNLVD